MKILFDQNLSHRLVTATSQIYPDSKHVKDFGLTGDNDEQIWQFAAKSDFILASKDSDFMYRALLLGVPS